MQRPETLQQGLNYWNWYWYMQITCSIRIDNISEILIISERYYTVCIRYHKIQYDICDMYQYQPIFKTLLSMIIILTAACIKPICFYEASKGSGVPNLFIHLFYKTHLLPSLESQRFRTRNHREVQKA